VRQHGHRVITPLHSPRPRLATGPRLWLAATIGVVLVAASACDAPDDETGGAPTGCAAVVRRASLATEVAEQVRLLDEALVTCSSYGALQSELARYPGIIGYETGTFVSLRCARVENDAVKNSATCLTVIDPTTTVPRTTLPDLVFVGDTLDGRRIEIRPTATTAFVGDVPAVVQQTVDIAFESGCEGVIAQRDLWAARTADPDVGDEASVYAQHAQNVSDYIQCGAPPIEIG
jgi:hypothetical protein